MKRMREGFTIVEILVTIVVGTVFIIAITQLMVAELSLTGAQRAYNTADLLAYNNLRIYANGKSPSWFQCVYSSGSPQPMTLISSTGTVSGLPGTVTQSVIATAPFGCGGGSASVGYPIKVISKVTYGVTGKTIIHATYATY